MNGLVIKAVALSARRWILLYAMAVVLFSLDYAQSSLGLDRAPQYITELASSHPLQFFLFLTGSCLLEYVFIVGFYYPGTLVFVTVVAACSGSAWKLAEIALAAFVSMPISAVVNYFIGRAISNGHAVWGHKVALDLARRALLKYGILASVALAFHPNYLGTLFVALGASRASFLRNLAAASIGSLVAVCAWIAVILMGVQLIGNSAQGHSKALAILCFSVAAVLTAWTAREKMNELS